MIARATVRELESETVSIVRLVEALLEDACAARASDIHIDPHQSRISVRFRIDGVLHHACYVDMLFRRALVSRIKILAGLRTDEHVLPQDGRYSHMIHITKIDVRVSCIPTQHGESVVMRLLIKQQQQYTLASLGFSDADCEVLRNAVGTTWGMVVVTGPTGCGKTTTLYSLIDILNTPDVSVVTIEDPIEYAIDGVKHIQTHSRAGLTFAHGLRSVLRQDPDVIMVGEIRDSETASIAVNTALTGHLLLSTLHTTNAATSIPRLLDMGIEPFLVASTLRVVVAQRLVRNICAGCKRSYTPTDIEKGMCERVIGAAPMELWRGVGCDACSHTGYSGRSVVAEILTIDESIREAIVSKMPASYIHECAIQSGMKGMIVRGIEHVLSGITTCEEIFSSLYEHH